MEDPYTDLDADVDYQTMMGRLEQTQEDHQRVTALENMIEEAGGDVDEGGKPLRFVDRRLSGEGDEARTSLPGIGKALSYGVGGTVLAGVGIAGLGVLGALGGAGLGALVGETLDRLPYFHHAVPEGIGMTAEYVHNDPQAGERFANRVEDDLDKLGAGLGFVGGYLRGKNYNINSS